MGTCSDIKIGHILFAAGQDAVGRDKGISLREQRVRGGSSVPKDQDKRLQDKRPEDTQRPKETQVLDYGLDRELRLEIDEDTGIVVAKVLDSRSGELIRQIPPEEVLDIIKQNQKAGLLVSREV